MKKNYKRSKKTRQKISNATKKFWESPAGLLKKQRLSVRTSNRMKTKTYEQIYGIKAKEIRNKISKTLKGISKSEEHNRKNSEAHKGVKRLPFSESWRKNIGKSQKGEKGSNWQGGKSFELYGLDWTIDLKENIKKRDNYTCQICGVHQNNLTGFFKKLDIHHIDYNKKNLNLGNLITLCRKCHTKTNHYRELWTKYFDNVYLQGRKL